MAPQDELASNRSSERPVSEVKDERTSAIEAEKNPFKRFLTVLGPGFITGASDDDPSGIGTYTMAGASFGYATLWMALLTFPLMAGVQFICARVGMATGRGLAAVLRQHYSRWLLYPVVLGLVAANTINAGVDIGAIAAACNLLLPRAPITWWIVPIGALILVLQLAGSYRLIERVFKWLALTLFAYLGAAFFAHPDWAEVLRGTLMPTLSWDPAYLAMLVALLGTTISPYLFFWQSDQEVEEEIEEGHTKLRQRQGTTKRALKYMARDVESGMFFSNVVMYFIILATGATLHATGHTQVQSATEAAQVLRPIAGEASSLLFALGLIGSGFLAVPILTTSAAFALSEAFDWPCGLNKKPSEARRFYGVIAASTCLGLAINFIGLNPIQALYGAALLNGALAPPILVVVMLVTNNQAIMRGRANGRRANTLGWATTAVMFVALGLLVWTSFAAR